MIKLFLFKSSPLLAVLLFHFFDHAYNWGFFGGFKRFLSWYLIFSSFSVYLNNSLNHCYFHARPKTWKIFNWKYRSSRARLIYYLFVFWLLYSSFLHRHDDYPSSRFYNFRTLALIISWKSRWPTQLFCRYHWMLYRSHHLPDYCFLHFSCYW